MLKECTLIMFQIETGFVIWNNPPEKTYMTPNLAWKEYELLVCIDFFSFFFEL